MTQTWLINEDSKDHIVTSLVGWLAARHPAAPRPQIEDTVAEEYDTLDKGPLRTFIPTLVEHSARNRLHREFTGQNSDS